MIVFLLFVVGCVLIIVCVSENSVFWEFDIGSICVVGLIVGSL